MASVLMLSTSAEIEGLPSQRSDYLHPEDETDMT